MSHLLTDKMRVGPKGQVVIPKSFRKILKVGVGSESFSASKESVWFLRKSLLILLEHLKP